MRTIALFARPPVLGRVKSRLSPALPPRLALQLYRGLLGDALEQMMATPADRRRVYWADSPTPDPGLALPRGVEPRAQQGADLGARLAHATREELAGEDDRVLVVGTDCPRLGPETMSRGFE